MGYIIAYLLLALVFDLIRELINPEGDHRNATAIHRRLWSDTLFDCRTKVFSVVTAAPRLPNPGRPNKYRPRKSAYMIVSGGC